MTAAERLASFVERASFEDLSGEARRQLRVRILDSLACALGALGSDVEARVRSHVGDLSRTGTSTLIGGGSSSPDLAAFYNGALVRYLDFNDSYLAKGETCHPSDNLAAVLAACESAGGSGRDLLAALAVAYQVECRLSDEAPVRARGFDHTTQGSYAAAAGVARALRLGAGETANAIAMSGTALNALRVTRTGRLSNWKGLAYPHTAFAATHLALLARKGLTGPLEVFEGKWGFEEAIAGPFEIDWEREDLERVTRTILKRFNAEIHSQSTLEAALELKAREGFRARDVERVEVATFDVAYHIIGGGMEGDKLTVRNKEEADHSLRYLVAVALLDGQVFPEQYRPARILRDDVQDLLSRVEVRPDEPYSRLFPERMATRVTVVLHDGRRLSVEKEDYEGFRTRPMSWETVVSKFERLALGRVSPALGREIAGAVKEIESIRVAELMALLARAERPSG